MPSINITLRKGCDDRAIERSMKQITQAAEDTLENTLVRMVRVSVFEVEPQWTFEGGHVKDSVNPTLTVGIGPGRSDEAVASFLSQATDILSQNLGCKKEDVRIYRTQSDPNLFAIGGVHKDFDKKVK